MKATEKMHWTLSTWGLFKGFVDDLFSIEPGRTGNQEAIDSLDECSRPME